MRVFLSWSGGDSQRAAEVLKPWLQQVLPGVEVWMSTHDIQAGSPWATVLHEQLRRAEFGILCLTPENLSAPWILYEAGALAMSSKVGCVVPLLLLDVAPEKLPAPLAQFQSVRADRAGTWKVVSSINAAGGDGMPEERLHKVFEMEWLALRRSLGLDITTQLCGDILVVTPSDPQMGCEDAFKILRDKMRAFILGGRRRIVIDLTDVRDLTSTGIAYLVHAQTSAKTRGAEVVLVNLHPRVGAMFEVTRMVSWIEQFPTLDEALAYFDDRK
jgi:anti-anti-sigma factor